MLKKILIAVVVVIVAVIGIAFLLPREVHVERSITIAKPPGEVFALLDNFQRFNEWSPWYERDPGMDIRYEGPESGVGARMIWSSENDNVGSGSQEIVEAVPGERVVSRLDFGDEGDGLATFDLEPEGDGTRLTWGFDTDLGMNPIARYFGLMFDGLIGPDYEAGLAKLKALVEAG